MRAQKSMSGVAWTVCLFLVASLVWPGPSQAKTKAEIDASVQAALTRFRTQIKGGDVFLRDAKAVLVFPGVVQAGIGVGGEYGEGALRIGGSNVAYYSIASGSFGFQFGAQVKDVLIMFMQQEALRNFQAKNGWQVGVDGSVVLVTVGAEGSIDTTKLNEPVVGFVVGQKGLMYNLSLKGTKISRLQR